MRLILMFFLPLLWVSNDSHAQTKRDPTKFIPEGFVLDKRIDGDVNHDGISDCVLIIQGTDKNKVVIDQYRGAMDRNRRGIIVLFSKNGVYQLATQNIDCFSSGAEDGGVYYPPELAIRFEKGNLIVHYAHGRYGHWSYTFRYRQTQFQLIGYDSREGGAIAQRETSINFLTKKKLSRENKNPGAEISPEVFKEIWESIRVGKLTQLSEIRDFDELDPISDL